MLRTATGSALNRGRRCCDHYAAVLQGGTMQSGDLQASLLQAGDASRWQNLKRRGARLLPVLQSDAARRQRLLPVLRQAIDVYTARRHRLQLNLLQTTNVGAGNCEVRGWKLHRPMLQGRIASCRRYYGPPMLLL